LERAVVAGGDFASATDAVTGCDESVDVGTYGRPPADESEGVEGFRRAEVTAIVGAVSEIEECRTKVWWYDRHRS